MKRILLYAAIAAGLAGILALCSWLNLPGSLVLTMRAIGEERHPIDFDFAYAGSSALPARVPVQLFYFPKTPIFGISEHYWSIIAPPRVDTITRTLRVDVRDGHVRWSAPLGLAGLSNFRLQSIQVGEAGTPYALQASQRTDPSVAPQDNSLPSSLVDAGAYRFDGAIALWRRSANEGPNPYVYAPRVDDVSPQLLWNGLRTFHARLNLAPYPFATFVVPGGWAGAGWENEGFQLSRPHATLTDKALSLRTGAELPLPFSRECVAAPEFAVLGEREIPAWSQIYGLWRPVSRAVWTALRRRAKAQGLVVHPASRARRTPSLDDVESLTVAAHAAGRYRLMAACPNPRYDSLAVTWIDVIASPSGAKAQAE